MAHASARLILILAMALSACGIKGPLEQPDPIFWVPGSDPTDLN